MNECMKTGGEIAAGYRYATKVDSGICVEMMNAIDYIAILALNTLLYLYNINSSQ